MNILFFNSIGVNNMVYLNSGLKFIVFVLFDDKCKFFMFFF